MCATLLQKFSSMNKNLKAVYKHSEIIIYPVSPSEVKSRNIYQQCVSISESFFSSYIITWMYFVPRVFKHLARCICNYAVEPFQPWIFYGVLSSL